MCSGCSGERANGEGVVPDGVGKALSLAQRLRGAVFRVEAKFSFLEKERKVGFRNAVVTAERALGLVPEVLDSIDVIVAIENVGVRVVDPVVMEPGDVEDS